MVVPLPVSGGLAARPLAREANEVRHALKWIREFQSSAVGNYSGQRRCRARATATQRNDGDRVEQRRQHCHGQADRRIRRDAPTSDTWGLLFLIGSVEPGEVNALG